MSSKTGSCDDRTRETGRRQFSHFLKDVEGRRKTLYQSACKEVHACRQLSARARVEELEEAAQSLEDIKRRYIWSIPSYHVIGINQPTPRADYHKIIANALAQKPQLERGQEKEILREFRSSLPDSLTNQSLASRGSARPRKYGLEKICQIISLEYRDAVRALNLMDIEQISSAGIEKLADNYLYGARTIGAAFFENIRNVYCCRNLRDLEERLCLLKNIRDFVENFKDMVLRKGRLLSKQIEKINHNKPSKKAILQAEKIRKNAIDNFPELKLSHFGTLKYLTPFSDYDQISVFIGNQNAQPDHRYRNYPEYFKVEHQGVDSDASVATDSDS
jgi:hypothetical protein